MIGKIALGLFGMMLIVTGATAVMIYKTGVIEISVKDQDGTSFYAPIPMLFLGTGVQLLPQDKLQEMRSKLGDNRKYLVNALQELSECPDGVFVEVESKRENVYIGKSDGNFIIDVKSPKEKVYIKIPIESSTKLVAHLVR